MKVLFLTTGRMESIEQHAIYPDLLRVFRDHGHDIYSVSAHERRDGMNTEYIEEHGHHALRVRIGNITKCSFVEKGISTVLIESQYKAAIKRYLSDVKFDLVLYSTPPITLVNIVKYIKNRDGAKTYLLLKDIFPQNALDLGMLRKTGLKGILYKYFIRKERMLYDVSDKIGCMSRANVDYVIKHNYNVPPSKVEVCPNSIEVQDMSITECVRDEIRKKYNIPLERRVFVYGGNLGKPQGISFIIEGLKTQIDNDKAFFLIVGDGTEFEKLMDFFEQYKPNNMALLQRLPKDEYDRMIAACDVGMIFLDHRFTIPNFPSRLLTYMQARLPVIACTDPNTDVGDVIVNGKFGWWCESNDAKCFNKVVSEVTHMEKTKLDYMSECAYHYLVKNYSAEDSYKIIMKSFGLI